MKVVLAELLLSLCQQWAAVLPHLGSPQGLPSPGGALPQLCTQAAPAPAPLQLHTLLLASLHFRQEQRLFGEQIFHSIPLSSMSKNVQCGSSGSTGRADWSQLFGSLLS